MSRAYKIISGTKHTLINLRNVAKVKLNSKEITFYYLSNSGILGMHVAGSGIVYSDNMLTVTDSVEFNTEKQAKEEFDKITELI